MKTLNKCTAAAITAIMLCSCANEVQTETTPQTVAESTYAENTETIQTETTEIESVSETEAISETESKAIVYEKNVHNYNRKFYDFLEITEDFYGDNEAFEATEEGAQIKTMFKEFIEQSGVTVTDIRITQTVTEDLNMDGEFETAAVVTAGFEIDETDSWLQIGTGEINPERTKEWSGLYFISSNGDIRLESDCQIISIDREFIYPDSKQLDVSFVAHDMMYISDRVYGYRNGEITALLDCGTTICKDCCFLYLPAKVGPFYPISPAMFYWDSTQEDYLTVNAVPVSKEDFEEILNSAPENDDMEDILQQFSQCAYIMNIGNRFYILREGNRGDLAVILDNDGSLEISHNMWNPILTFTYDSPADVDYFAAVDSMIKV